MSLCETVKRWFAGSTDEANVRVIPWPNDQLIRSRRKPDDPAIRAMIQHLAEEIPMYHMLECRVYFVWPLRAWTILPLECTPRDIALTNLGYWITEELADDMFCGGINADLKEELLECGHDLLAYWAWRNDPQYNIKEGHQ